MIIDCLLCQWTIAKYIYKAIARLVFQMHFVIIVMLKITFLQRISAVHDLITYVTGFWKNDQIVTLGQFHFIGQTNGHIRTLRIHSVSIRLG